MQQINLDIANIIAVLVAQKGIDLGDYTPEQFADDIVDMSTLPEDFQRARADAWDEGADEQYYFSERLSNSAHNKYRKD